MKTQAKIPAANPTLRSSLTMSTIAGALAVATLFGCDMTVSKPVESTVSTVDPNSASGRLEEYLRAHKILDRATYTCRDNGFCDVRHLFNHLEWMRINCSETMCFNNMDKMKIAYGG